MFGGSGERGRRARVWAQILFASPYRLSAAAAELGISNGVLYALHGSWAYTTAIQREIGLGPIESEKPGADQWLLVGSLLAGAASPPFNAAALCEVDRLTRSLSDFAKIVDVFDAHNASFVSVTQQKNGYRTAFYLSIAPGARGPHVKISMT